MNNLPRQVGFMEGLENQTRLVQDRFSGTNRFFHDIDGTLSRLVGSHVEASKFDAKIAANHLKLSLLVFLTSPIIPRTLNPQAKF